MRWLPMFALAVCFVLLNVPPAGATLTEASRLAAIYDAILAADFDAATARLKTACPPAPVEACRALAGVVVWWQILMDPDSPALDTKLEQTAKSAIDAATAWTKREPKRAEAWFYLAGSYAPLVQLRVMRGERLSAARDGNRIRDALERAVSLDPALTDAYFGIGLYHYYADVAPLAARILRVLMLLPGGDRKKGMEEMNKARQQGVLLAGEADFQMHWLYLWYEEQPKAALALVQSLDARFPTNPVFLQRAAEIQAGELKDHAASAASWEALLSRARAGRFAQPSLARTVEVRARLGLARELIELSQPDRAIEQVNAVLTPAPASPYSSLALAHFYLGRAYERLGRFDQAINEYNQATALAPSDDPRGIRAAARTHTRDAKSARDRARE